MRMVCWLRQLSISKAKNTNIHKLPNRKPARSKGFKITKWHESMLLWELKLNLS